jgi:glycosyltransferase involved in cell wall biosynthesis
VKKKIRVLINADCARDAINAQDRNGKHWAIFLDKEKYDIGIYASGEIDDRLCGLPGVRVYRLSRRRLPALLTWLRHFLLHRWDVVLNAKASWREWLLVTLRKLSKRGVNIISFAVNQVPYGEDHLLRTKMQNRVLFESDLLVANSKRVASTVLEYRGRSVPVVNNFIDISLFTPEAHSNARKIVMCVGSMIAAKQPFLFANIAKMVPEADFVWIGERYYYRDMQRKVEREQIHNLELPGKVANCGLPQMLAKADIFLFPSIQEGFPNVVVEAMACGLPVIAMDRFGPEAVVDGVTGYVVGTEFEMLEKLRYLLASDDLRATFRRNARERACEYDGARLVVRLEELIDRLACERV